MAEELKRGDRVAAKYKGIGTIVPASFDMLDKPHFEDDVCVAWDEGSIDWHGPAILTKIKSIGGQKP